MPFISTSGRAPAAPLREALFRGLAPDGGLYMPTTLPLLDPGELQRFPAMEWREVSATLSRLVLESELDGSASAHLANEALNFPIPLVPLTDRIHILELFRGPTLAFKDVGARFMAQLVGHMGPTDAKTLNILTATSGDTGGAVAQAFHGMAGVRVVVLFPDGKVTPRQERQFSTLGGNVQALAIQGDFDDCQRMVKAAFQNQRLRRAVPLSSANSINIGRLLPQTFYYVWAWAQLQKEMGEGQELLFSVPSGNFGNLAAGILARGMGLPGVRFLAATNANDGVPTYLETGEFEARPSIPTLSTAMDVGNPSNLARILHLYGHDLERLREDVTGTRISDQETRDCIRRIHNENGYTLDPHTAVGYQGLERELRNRPSTRGIVLATAHPAKFAEVVEPILGQTLPLPPELSACLERERRATPMGPDDEALEEYLLALEE
jgi:threonine synthase